MDVYAMLCVPTVLTDFVPICETGERASQARASVATGAYFGPWQEEPPRQARLRLGMLQASPVAGWGMSRASMQSHSVKSLSFPYAGGGRAGAEAALHGSGPLAQGGLHGHPQVVVRLAADPLQHAEKIGG